MAQTDSWNVALIFFFLLFCCCNTTYLDNVLHFLIKKTKQDKNNNIPEQSCFCCDAKVYLCVCQRTATKVWEVFMPNITFCFIYLFDEIHYILFTTLRHKSLEISLTSSHSWWELLAEDGFNVNKAQVFVPWRAQQHLPELFQ